MTRKIRKPITPAELRALLEMYREAGDNGRETARRWNERTGEDSDPRTVARWIARAVELDDVGGLAVDAADIPTEPKKPPTIEVKINPSGKTISGRGIKTLEELLDAAGVDLSGWVVTRYRVNSWEAQAKGGEVVTLHQVTAHLERRPSWFLSAVPVVQPIRREPPTSTPALREALIVPDSQHGFRRRRDGTLEPLHDRRAVDLTIQIARLLQPSEIVLLGDMLDLAPFGTYTVEPALRYTTQPALVELHWFLMQLRLAAPQARIVYLEGNHEHRITKAIADKLSEAAELRPVGSDDGPPALSVPYLLNLAALDIEYRGPYGADYWLFDAVRIHHGSIVRQKGGATVSAMLANATHSQVVGHIHRREVGARQIETIDGPRTIWAASPGCLCRVDSMIVPGQPGRSIPNWHLGCGIVTDSPAGPRWTPVSFDRGVAIFRGHVLHGEARSTPENLSI